MGMYTHFVINCNLKEDTPQEVIDTLLYLSSQSSYNPINESHELFMLENIGLVMSGYSSVFDGDGYYKFRYDEAREEWRLTINSNIKNYKKEYQKFLDYIQPCITMEGYQNKKFLGYMRDEETDKLTLIYNTKNGIRYKEVK